MAHVRASNIGLAAELAAPPVVVRRPRGLPYHPTSTLFPVSDGMSGPAEPRPISAKAWLWARMKARDPEVMAWLLAIRPGDDIVCDMPADGEAVVAAWRYLRDQGAPIGSCSGKRVVPSGA